MYEKLENIIEKETGKIVDGRAICEEIERAAGQAEEGAQWITGQDDAAQKWEYYVDINRTYDEDNDQYDTKISLQEIAIEDKQTGRRWQFDTPEITIL